MGKPRIQTVETTQKQELDPIAQGYLWSGQLPAEKIASLRRINEQVYGMAPGTLTPAPTPGATSVVPQSMGGFFKIENRTSGSEEARQEAAMMDAMYGPVQGPNQPRGGGGGLREAFSSATGGYTGLGDMIDGGGPGRSGDRFEGGGRLSDVANAVSGRGPEAQKLAMGGIVALARGGMVPPMVGGRMPNLSDRDMAYRMAMEAMQRRGYAVGGYVEGPGTGTSDSIPAKIYQDGRPVQEAALSDGEFVMTKKAVDGAGGPARMYEMMRRFERGGSVR
jgi:hypothetical protein